jgi:hypothetical protein
MSSIRELEHLFSLADSRRFEKQIRCQRRMWQTPYIWEVRREVFDEVVRTRDLRTGRELKYWKNMCCRIYGTKGCDFFLPAKKKILEIRSLLQCCI